MVSILFGIFLSTKIWKRIPSCTEVDEEYNSHIVDEADINNLAPLQRVDSPTNLVGGLQLRTNISTNILI